MMRRNRYTRELSTRGQAEVNTSRSATTVEMNPALPRSSKWMRFADWRLLLSTASLPFIVLTGCSQPDTTQQNCITYYQDGDGDGVGGDATTQVCDGQAAPSGFVAAGGDCADNDASVSPRAAEVCDARDNNCNRQTDEAGNIYYADEDGDSFGGSHTTTGCALPPGYVENALDCLDSDASVFPGASELCDGRDNNCDGVLGETEVERAGNGQLLCEAVVNFLSDLGELTLEQGDTHNIAFPVGLQVENLGNEYSVNFSYEVQPFDSVIDRASEFAFPFGAKYTESIEGMSNAAIRTSYINDAGEEVLATPGDYDIQITADTSSGSIDIAVLKLHVVERGALRDRMALSHVGTFPDAVAVASEAGLSSPINFTVTVSGVRKGPESISLERFDGANWQYVGELFDDGAGEDVAGDLVYSGLFGVERPTGEVIQKFRAVVDDGEDEILSPEKPVFATSFPIGVAEAIVELWNQTPDTLSTGERIICDQASVIFESGTSSDDIREVLEGINGVEILGYLPTLEVFQIGINPATCDVPTIQGIVDSIKASSPLVKVAQVEPITTPDSWLDDPNYVSQNNMKVIRANEAWYISQGSILIGDIDTGCDYNHSELPKDTKIINGKDFVANDSDSMDGDGHGTHTAGILGALTNNNNGVAGVSWSSKILATRGMGGTVTQMASAIQYAADQGAKVLNISGGTDVNTTSLENACKYANQTKGSLIFAAAGGASGTGTQKSRYPASYVYVVGVASTNDDDTKASTSRWGEWVDLSAPGVNILSTNLGGGYSTRTGTSQASALAAGAAAVVWSMNPSMSSTQVMNRLQFSGKLLDPTLGLGKSRVDLFEAIFDGNGDLKGTDGTPDMAEWTSTGTCTKMSSLGSITPNSGGLMLYCSTGPADGLTDTFLTNNVTFTENLSSVTVSFDYNIVSEEYPEWVSNIFNDYLEAYTVDKDGNETQIDLISVNDIGNTGFAPITYDFSGGDATMGASGWRTATATIPLVKGTGSWKLRVSDEADALYDTAVLLDRVRFAN